MDHIAEVGRSTLSGTWCTLIGYGYGSNPIKPNGFLATYVYRNDQRWIICTSEGMGAFDPTRMVLGTEVPGDGIAEFAERLIEGNVDYAELRNLIEEGFSLNVANPTYQWLDNLPED